MPTNYLLCFSLRRGMSTIDPLYWTKPIWHLEWIIFHGFRLLSLPSSGLSNRDWHLKKTYFTIIDKIISAVIAGRFEPRQWRADGTESHRKRNGWSFEPGQWEFTVDVAGSSAGQAVWPKDVGREEGELPGRAWRMFRSFGRERGRQNVHI